MDCSHDFHRRCRLLMARQLQARIYTRLTDVTRARALTSVSDTAEPMFHVTRRRRGVDSKFWFRDASPQPTELGAFISAVSDSLTRHCRGRRPLG
jgi:hypothetical protein